LNTSFGSSFAGVVAFFCAVREMQRVSSNRLLKSLRLHITVGFENG
jgi:hypothetical protein